MACKRMGAEYHARGGRVENHWWKLKRQLHGRRKAAKFNECVVTATGGLGIEQMSRAVTTLQTARNHIDLRVSPRRLLRVREQCGIGMAPRELGCKAQAEASRANGSGIAVQLPPCDENED